MRQLQIALLTWVAWLVFVSALYNPFGFLLQAIKPDIADGDGVGYKISVIMGFLPLTIGLGWAAIVIMCATVKVLG